MQRTDYSQENRPSARTLGLVGDWWRLLIIRKEIGLAAVPSRADPA